MGKLTVTSFITLDNVVEDPHLWSGQFQSEDTGLLNDAVLREADVLLVSPLVHAKGIRMFRDGGEQHGLRITEATVLGGGMLALRMTPAGNGATS